MLAELKDAQQVAKEINELGYCKSIGIEADISLESDCIELIEKTVSTI